MAAYFERLIGFVGAHPQLSFFAVFLLAFSEGNGDIVGVLEAWEASERG